MYIGAYGLGGRSEELMKSDLGRGFTRHLEGLPQIEMDENLPRDNTPLAPLSQNFQEFFSQGWALQNVIRERTTFTRKQEKFVESIFHEGRNKKKKTKPLEVVEMMRHNKIFSPSEWLTESQVKYFVPR